MSRKTDQTRAGRPAPRDIASLRRILPFLAPYRLQFVAAGVALVVAAGTVLAMGVGLKQLVDKGFASGNVALLDDALLVLFGVVIILSLATAARFYFVSWIGERVVADLRCAVYDRVIGLSPAFFEITRTGEILSRLTTDTTLIESVVGS
jgi:ATP-binding cassette, subfamily B, bacterial